MHTVHVNVHCTQRWAVATPAARGGKVLRTTNLWFFHSQKTSYTSSLSWGKNKLHFSAGVKKIFGLELWIPWYLRGRAERMRKFPMRKMIREGHTSSVFQNIRLRRKAHSLHTNRSSEISQRGFWLARFLFNCSSLAGPEKLFFCIEALDSLWMPMWDKFLCAIYAWAPKSGAYAHAQLCPWYSRILLNFFNFIK